jgi:hypothetical protein
MDNLYFIKFNDLITIITKYHLLINLNLFYSKHFKKFNTNLIIKYFYHNPKFTIN